MLRTWLVLATVTSLAQDAQACAVCVGWTEGQPLNGGFYWSALLLTALPFALVAAVGVCAGRALRRSRERETRE